MTSYLESFSDFLRSRLPLGSPATTGSTSARVETAPLLHPYQDNGELIPETIIIDHPEDLGDLLEESNQLLSIPTGSKSPPPSAQNLAINQALSAPPVRPGTPVPSAALAALSTSTLLFPSNWRFFQDQEPMEASPTSATSTTNPNLPSSSSAGVTVPAPRTTAVTIEANARNIPVLPEQFCRYCHQVEPQKELFRPCRCAGVIAQAHRSCLDQWRVCGRFADGFTHCNYCQYQYRTVALQNRLGGRCHYCYKYLIKNPILLMFLNITSLLLVTVLARFLDPHNGLIRSLATAFPSLVTYLQGRDLPVSPVDRVIFDWYICYYYLLVTAVYMFLLLFFWFIAFICARNRRMFLSYFSFCGFLGVVGLFVLSAIISLVMNIVLGAIFLSLILQIFLFQYYQYRRQVYQAALLTVLPYDPGTDVDNQAGLPRGDDNV